jgi:hypothetical protein
MVCSDECPVPEFRFGEHPRKSVIGERLVPVAKLEGLFSDCLAILWILLLLLFITVRGQITAREYLDSWVMRRIA